MLDERAESFGIRTVEIRDRGLWLNGERVRLTGMTRHEESPQEGLAETRGTMKADWDDMKALQVVLTRPVHYPQHPYVLDYADRNGVLLVPEIPMWQFSEEQMKDPKVLALAKRMMQEMIEQAGNHPSIFAWSVCNESATSTPGRPRLREGDGRAREGARPRTLRQLRRRRPAVDHGRRAEREPVHRLHHDEPVLRELGGPGGGPRARPRAAWGRMFPDKMVVISEFGLAGPFAPDTAQADRMRVEDHGEPARRVREARLRRRRASSGATRTTSRTGTSGPASRPTGSRWGSSTRTASGCRRTRSGRSGRARRASASSGDARPDRASRSASGRRVERRPPTELPSYELRGYRLEWEARDHDGTLLASGAASSR